MARRAWEEVKRMIADPGYDMVVADELNIVLRYDYLPLDEVLTALRAKPAMTHVIVTGRNAPDALVDMADLVTEMSLVRSEEHTSELQSLMRTSYAVFCLKKKNTSLQISRSSTQ